MAVATTGQYNGMADCAVKIFRQSGIRAFFRGYGPNIIGIVPYAGIDLSIYEVSGLILVLIVGFMFSCNVGVWLHHVLDKAAPSGWEWMGRTPTWD